MSKIDGSLSSHYSDAVQPRQKGAERAKGPKTKGAEASEQTGKSGQVQLSDAAQKLLEKLKKKHGNIDFMVADSANAADAKKMMSGSDKEYSVLFSAEELEKMASDEKFEHEYMAKVEGAIQMTNKISQQFGFNPAQGELTSVGVSIDDNGTKTFFAEMEKASEQQRKMIEEARGRRADERKDTPAKKVTVQANYQLELFDKLNAVDWNKV